MKAAVAGSLIDELRNADQAKLFHSGLSASCKGLRVTGVLVDTVLRKQEYKTPVLTTMPS